MKRIHITIDEKLLEWIDKTTKGWRGMGNRSYRIEELINKGREAEACNESLELQPVPIGKLAGSIINVAGRKFMTTETGGVVDVTDDERSQP